MARGKHERARRGSYVPTLGNITMSVDYGPEGAASVILKDHPDGSVEVLQSNIIEQPLK